MRHFLGSRSFIRSKTSFAVSIHLFHGLLISFVRWVGRPVDRSLVRIGFPF